MNQRAVITWIAVCTLAAVVLPTTPGGAAQQWTPEKRGSDNLTVVSHLPLGPSRNVADIELEQELSRPYAYVARMVYGAEGDKGMDIIDLHDETRPEVIYEWRIENQDLHAGNGAMDVKYFKWDDRYYVVLSMQFGQWRSGQPISGAVILDVTGLPDASIPCARSHASVTPETAGWVSTTSSSTSTAMAVCCLFSHHLRARSR